MYLEAIISKNPRLNAHRRVLRQILTDLASIALMVAISTHVDRGGVDAGIFLCDTRLKWPI
jgi:hypothetical protein